MIIIGNNTYLRALELTDNDLLRELINDPETEKMIGGSSLPVSTSQQELWIKNQIGRKDVIRYIIADKQTDKAVGTIILTDIDYKNGVAQIHIKIAKNARHSGYGTDALTSLIKYAFSELRLNCLYATVVSYNAASAKMFEKCGFEREGVLKQRIFKNGTYHDVYSYSILSASVSKND